MGKTVLLADDDADDAEIFQETLEEVDPSARLHRVESGAAILQYLKDNMKPDIIFMDLNMPLMNGWQCLVKLKTTKGLEDIPVIIYTTSSNPRDYEIAQALNAHGLITKPTDHKVLKKVLQIIIPNLNTVQLKEAIKEAYAISKD